MILRYGPLRRLVMHTALAALLGTGLTALPTVSGTAEAAAVPTHGVWGSYLAGRHAQRVRDYPAAIEFLGRSLRDDPGNLDVLRQLFLLTVAEGQIDYALTLAPQVLEAAQTEPLPAMVLLLDRFHAGAYQETLDRLAAEEAYGLNQIVMPFVQAWAQAAVGRREEALALMAADAAPEGLGSLYAVNRGLLLEYLGDAAAAEAEYKATLASAGGSDQQPFAVTDALAALYERQGRADEARALYEAYAEATESRRMIEAAVARLDGDGTPTPNRATPDAAISDLFFSVASSLSQEGNEIFSYVFSRLAVFLDPGNGLALALLAQNLAAQEREEDAIAVYAQVPLSSPMGFSARLSMADAMNGLDQVDEAIAALEELAATYPDDYVPLASVGDYLRGQERYEEALDAYERAFARVPEIKHEHWSLLYYRGIALERTGNWERAEKDFLAALDFEPNQPFVLNYLGYSWVEQGIHLEEAKQMIETAVEERPRDGFIVDSLGWVLYKLGDYEGAVPHLERAVELEPGDAVINDHLGDAFWRVGRRTEARYQWNRAMELDPDEELAATLEAKLTDGLPDGPTVD
ncbi:MAG: tetratricopeptide repeat protein [Alphaproteobacteria bacterium]